MAKVFCKKSISCFSQDNYYEVLIEFDDSYWIYSKNQIDIQKFFKNKNEFNRNIFSNFFCDIREARREKLNNIFDNKD